MTAPRDADRLIRAFLEEGQTELPDRTFDAVRSHIERTRQRAVIGPWRDFRMLNVFRWGAAAAVALVLAVVGLNLLIPRGSVGPPASASPATSPVRPSPTVSATAPPPIGTCVVRFTDSASGGELQAPYLVTLGRGGSGILGAVVSPFPIVGPYAQINFEITNLTAAQKNPRSRPGVQLIPPGGPMGGYATSMVGALVDPPVNGFVGSILVDVAGTWTARLAGVEGCVREITIEVLPKPGG